MYIHTHTHKDYLLRIKKTNPKSLLRGKWGGGVVSNFYFCSGVLGANNSNNSLSLLRFASVPSTSALV